MSWQILRIVGLCIWNSLVVLEMDHIMFDIIEVSYLHTIFKLLYLFWFDKLTGLFLVLSDIACVKPYLMTNLMAGR